MTATAAKTAPLSVQGKVKTIIFGPTSDGFMTIALQTGQGRIVAVGRNVLSNLVVDEDVKLVGQWCHHKRYGRQFAANDVHRIVPETNDGLIRWIAQIGIPGVAEGAARKLVNLCGAQVIDRIIARDASAMAILGDRAEEAVVHLTLRSAEKELGPLLAQYGIGPAMRDKIFTKYGAQTAKVLQEDPYRLIPDVEGIGFSTADQIAKAIGLVNGSSSQINAAIIDTVREGVREGHAAMSDTDIVLGVRKRVMIDTSAIMACLKQIGAPLAKTSIEGQPAHALARIDIAERLTAEYVATKLHHRPQISADLARASVAIAEQRMGTELNEAQREASIQALTSSISILTGGPGTGKTHTLKVICEAWKIASRQAGVEQTILLSAPTGKAAKRMTKATGLEAKTLHRLLEISQDGLFLRNANNPLEAGLIAVDEFSMTDSELAAAFSSAWGKANILITGDVDQLPSVGAGRVLADLIESAVIPVTRLTEVRRQAEGSAVALGAAEIRQGRQPAMTTAGQSDFVFIEAYEGENDWIAAQIVKQARSLSKQGCDVQVLCPGHKAEIGTIAINQALQASAHGDSQTDAPVIRLGGGVPARVGDKVIQLENDYDREIFNGDTGIVTEIETDAKGQSVGATIRFEEATHQFEAKALGQIGLAYALSVHKSQGSEYDAVIIPLSTSHYGLLQRSLLYTAVTRAKSKCVIIGSKRALRIALEANSSARRQTTLANRLKALV